MKYLPKIILLYCVLFFTMLSQQRIRDYGIIIGSYPTGIRNAITDVEGVTVGQVTRVEGSDIRTGVTAVLPHQGNIFMEKVPAAVYVANGFGKMTGLSQIDELGEIETPIVLTNTLSVPTAADALIDYTLSVDNNKESVRSINPVVGETNDGSLNDIQGRHVSKKDVLTAITNAESGPVTEGSVGAGTGTICFGYKGGIGTSSRVLPEKNGGYTIGVLVQTNFGGDLTVAGIPMERELKKMESHNSGDGSCMVVIATNAPLTARNLKRLAKRATFGIARTGGHCSNGSGEYAIAFSTAEELRIPYFSGGEKLLTEQELRNDTMTPLFEAVGEATEEAILNSLFASKTMTGRNGLTIKGLPVEAVVRILNKHKMIDMH